MYKSSGYIDLKPWLIFLKPIVPSPGYNMLKIKIATIIITVRTDYY